MMKRYANWMMFLLVVTVGVAGAPASFAGEDAPDRARFARGAKAWANHCGRCHNIRDPKDFPDAEWDVIVTHMRVRGNLPGNVAHDIEAFLKGSN